MQKDNQFREETFQQIKIRVTDRDIREYHRCDAGLLFAPGCEVSAGAHYIICYIQQMN